MPRYPGWWPFRPSWESVALRSDSLMQIAIAWPSRELPPSALQVWSFICWLNGWNPLNSRRASSLWRPNPCRSWRPRSLHQHRNRSRRRPGNSPKTLGEAGLVGESSRETAGKPRFDRRFASATPDLAQTDALAGPWAFNYECLALSHGNPPPIGVLELNRFGAPVKISVPIAGDTKISGNMRFSTITEANSATYGFAKQLVDSSLVHEDWHLKIVQKNFI